MEKKKNGKLILLLQKLARYSKDQKGFVLYLIWLITILLLFPMVNISDIDWTWWWNLWLLWATYWKTWFIIFVCLAIMFAWNISFKIKNLMIKYFDFKSDDLKINFICLLIILVAFFAITDTISATYLVSPRIGMTFWGWTTQILLLVGFIFNLVFLVKQAKINGKKTKIVNIHNETWKNEKASDEKDNSQLKWLFGDNKSV